MADGVFFKPRYRLFVIDRPRLSMYSVEKIYFVLDGVDGGGADKNNDLAFVSRVVDLWGEGFAESRLAETVVDNTGTTYDVFFDSIFIPRPRKQLEYLQRNETQFHG